MPSLSALHQVASFNVEGRRRLDTIPISSSIVCKKNILCPSIRIACIPLGIPRKAQCQNIVTALKLWPRTRLAGDFGVHRGTQKQREEDRRSCNSWKKQSLKLQLAGFGLLGASRVASHLGLFYKKKTGSGDESAQKCSHTWIIYNSPFFLSRLTMQMIWLTI